jgi:phosphoribosylformylglycinamidine synthase
VIASAHDIAEGGLAVALAECCLGGELGAEVSLGEDFWETTSPVAPGLRSVSPASTRVTAALFGEGAGGFVVSGAEEVLSGLAERTSVRRIGTVGGDTLRIELAGETLVATLADLAEAHAALGIFFP